MKLSVTALMETALRIIGVLVIIRAINNFILSVPFLLSTEHSWAAVDQLLAVLSPLIFLFVGIYLIKSTPGIAKWLMQSWENDEENSSQVMFILAMKISGVVLIVYSIPQVLRIISNAIYVGYWYSNHLIIIASNLLTTVVSLIFGYYLLRGGRCFYSMAFSTDHQATDEQKK